MLQYIPYHNYWYLMARTKKGITKPKGKVKKSKPVVSKRVRRPDPVATNRDTSPPFLCAICARPHPPSTNSFRLASCSHIFCRDMIMTHAMYKAPRPFPITCPVCSSSLKESEIQELLPIDVYERYKRRLLLFNNPYYRECPFCNVLCTEINRANEEVTCPGCNKSFCFTHSTAHNMETTCKEYETRFSKKERKSISAIKVLSRPCPECSVPIEKNGGCAAMFCIQCHTVC